jgi:hypothetical protein
LKKNCNQNFFKKLDNKEVFLLKKYHQNKEFCLAKKCWKEKNKRNNKKEENWLVQA